MIKEDLLHFIWQNKLINAQKLETTKGEAITIKSVGTLNHNAGPDFKNAQLKIEDKLWAGHVEIHINAKDWFNHNHHNDRNYDNVILHVVLFNDYETKLPTLELNGKIRRELLNRYQELMESKNWIPCEESFLWVDNITLVQVKNRLIIERLERKIEQISIDLETTHNNWEEVFYRNLMRYAGLKVNKSAFERLSYLLPFKLISKYTTDPFAVEALLFGVGGFLIEVNNDYQKRLKTEYLFLKHKYKLKEMAIKEWNFATLRPANFPTIRIAQLSKLFCSKSLSFSRIIESSSYEQIISDLQKIRTDLFWDSHYHFEEKSQTIKPKKLGKTYLQLLVINHFVPVLYAYGAYKANSYLKEKSIDILSQTKREDNKITKGWEKIGLKSNTAFDTQALIELKNQYCDLKKCLNCSIGNKLLRKIEI